MSDTHDRTPHAQGDGDSGARVIKLGPLAEMTVSEVLPGDQVRCRWFVGGTLHEAMFDATELELCA